MSHSGHGGDGHDHHDHSEGCCDHDHDQGDGERGVLFSLYEKIDLHNLVCLNEAEEGTGRTVFKPWNERRDREHFVDSEEDDPELLFIIPFTGRVKLKSIIVSGEDNTSHPGNIRLFANKPVRSFDDCGISSNTCDQEFELMRDPLAEIEYPLKVTKFGSVYSLALHIQHNFGDPHTRVYYIGLKGEFMPERRQELVITSYEAFANPADHKIKEPETNQYIIR